MLLLIFIVLPLGGLAIYLAALASVSVARERDATIKLTLAQLFMIWLVPIAGPLFVLHVLYEVSPALVPLAAVPWPLRSSIKS